MPVHKWFGLAISLMGALVWLVLYAFARFGHRDVSRWRTPLQVAGIVLALVWLGCFIAGYERVANLLEPNWLGLFCASNWLASRYRLTSPTITTLNLSEHASDAHNDVSDQHQTSEPPA